MMVWARREDNSRVLVRLFEKRYDVVNAACR